MDNYIFESHNLEYKDIPIIFHFNRLKNSYTGHNWHSNIEILHFTGGYGKVTLGNEEIEVKKDDTIVINSNILHLISSDDILEYYCLIIDDEFLKYNGIHCNKCEFESHIQSEELSILFNAAVSEIEGQNSFREAGVKSALLRLMLYILRNHSSPVTSGAVPSNSNESIRLAIGYIHSHIYDKITLDEIANEVGLSKFHFVREFKKATGMTLITYINSIRCLHAKKLLLNGELSIHEVAFKCGFDNNSYFSKTFKKHIGVLPSKLIKSQYIVNE